MKQIEINVIGHRVKVMGENSQHVQQYAEYLDNYLREISAQYNCLDQKTMFILTGLNLVEKIFELEEKNKELSKELNNVSALLQNL